METGTLILAMHDTRGESAVAERLRNHLLNRGRRNVFIGYHRGIPDCYDVFLEMNRKGVDTYCILPLTVFEGHQTVWDMPKHLTLPDNSGSWTMIGEHDVATRFSTPVGANEALGEAISGHLGQVDDDEGLVLVCRGSDLSFTERIMNSYAEYFGNLGWKVAVAYAVKGPVSMTDAVRSLECCSRLHIIPFFISPESQSLKRSLGAIDHPFIVEPCVSDHQAFLEALYHRVPEGW